MSEATEASSAVETNETNVAETATDVSDGNYHSFEDLASQDTRSDAEVMKEVAKEVKQSNESVKETIKEVAKEDKLSENDTQTNMEEIGDAAEAELVAEIKKLTGKWKEESYELPEDVAFTTKIDGEEVDVSLKDLRANYSGKVAWDKKFQELGSERKIFNEERGIIENYVNTFGELVNKGDRLGAMQYLAQLSGQNPLEFKRELRNQILSEYKQLNEMDEVQRKAFELQEENEFLRQSKESESQFREQEQSRMELANRQAEIQEALSLDEFAWEGLQKELMEEGYEADQLTPDFIGEYAYAKQTFDRAEGLLAKVDESYVTDNNIDALGDVMFKNPDFTDEDLMEIISESLGEPKSKKTSVSKKAASSAKKKEEQQPTTYSERLKQSKIDQFYSFDELEDN